jgi:predicted lipoprotein with Yx(FWY)xxD motif
VNNRRKIAAGVVAVAVLAAIIATAALAGSGSSSSTGKPVVKTAKVLGKKGLVNRSGMTLYSLSAETHGRFICTDTTCLSLWKPLIAARGTKPTGASHLGTVKRPDHRTQVTYEGKPLYTFTGDKKPGDAKGDGFKDVGTWHVARGGAASKPAPSQPMNQGYPSY